MTDLQMSLILLGGTILVVLISYNKWQEYKVRKSVERAFTSTHDDVLMQSDVDDGADAAAYKVAHPVANNSLPDTAYSVAADADNASSLAYTALTESLAADSTPDLSVDPLIDCILPFELAAPVAGEKVMSLLESVRYAGNKPVHFIGHNTDGEWEDIVRGGTYSALQAGVQMANRHGALNEIDYSEVVMHLRQVADALDADLDVPDMLSVMRSARELQQFVNECTAQLSINVASAGAPWDVTTLMTALKRLGFDVRPNGLIVMPDGDTAVLFSLLTSGAPPAATTGLLTLLLDVPCVPAARDGFAAMVACARMLADRFDGVLVDDDRQPLMDEALMEITLQLEAFYQQMEAADVPAGSPRALRLLA